MIAIYRACLAGIVCFVASGLAKSAIRSHSIEWRLVPVNDDVAKTFTRGVRLLVAIAMATVWFASLGELADVKTPHFDAVTAFFGDITIVLLAARILPHRLLSEDEEEPHNWIRISSTLVGVVLIAVPILDLASYSYLASYLLLYLIISMTVLGLALLVRAAALEAIDWLINPQRGLRRFVGQGAETAGTNLLRLVLKATVDIVIFVPLAWLLLILYGIPQAQFFIWMNHFVDGFTIGSVTIAPFDVILGIIVFAAILLFTNFIRRATAKQLTKRTQFDVGARNAVLSGIHYTGIVIALVLAVSTMGLDFSNLTLVASALSVGIGFGLRTIVENFVAGLVLLIERPIKEGDWIVTGGRDGTVKKISVRSTEVETFDRSRIIVPNSELIAQPVENWSLRNRNARVIIPVGVAYGSDTAKVREILFDCMKDNSDIMPYPESQVLFLAFGESSLDFEVRFFVRDTDLRLKTMSDMHFAIDSGFRKAGIEIPFPQRDVHVKTDASPPPAEPALE